MANVSALSYRKIDGEGRTGRTPQVLKALADAALLVLAREGAVDPGASSWRFSGRSPDGAKLRLTCRGPDLPSTVPDDLVPPSDIPKDPRWGGTHRLIVVAPLVTLDLCWRPDEPLRIQVFSRGDWEALLVDVASGRCNLERVDDDAPALLDRQT